jgi:hypothetical protein
MAGLDYAGLLTGISPQSAKIDPFSLPTAGQQRMAFGAQQAQGVQRAGEGLFNLQSQNPVELAKTKLVGLDPTNPEDQPQFIQLLNIVDPAKAAQFKQQLEAKKLAETEKTAKKTQQQIERASFADYLELEYGDKATKLRPAVMAGSINAGNFDKVFKAEEKLSRTPKNVTYTDANGKIQKQLVFVDTQGGTYDQANNPIVLPDDAQLTITGQTAQDVAPGISKFSPKELARVREDILTSRMQLRTLAPVTEEAIDKYLSFLGKGKAGVGKVLSSATGLGGDFVNEMLKQATGGTDLIEFAGEQGVLFGTLENYFNKKKHDITGAAAAASELRAIRKGLLGGELEPTVAKARLKKVIEEEQYKLDTNFGLLKSNGLDVNAYFDKPVDKNESSGQTASKKIDSKSQLNAPKMEAANRVKTLLSGVDPQEETDR